MKKALSLIVVTQAFLLLSGCSSLFMKSDPLTLNLEQGSTHNLVQETNVQAFSDATMTDEVMNMKMTIMVDYTVSKVAENGNLTVDAKVSAVKLKQNMSGMGMNYDSQNPDSTDENGEMASEHFDPIINQMVIVNLDKYGEIIKDENAEPAVPGTNPESLIKQVFSKLPGCELKVGAIWIQEMDSTSTVEAPMIYTVESVDKDKVSFTFTIDKSKSKDTDAISDLQSGGKAIYNRKTGKLIETTNNSTMKGNSPQMGEFYMVSTTSIKAVK